MKKGFYYITAIIVTAACFGAFGATSNNNDNHVPQDVFDGMKQSFRPEKTKGLHLSYQWELSGPDGGQWWIEVNDGKCKMGRGKIDNPNVTFITSDKNWVAMSNGKLKGSWAFVTGRLKVRGSQADARKLDEIFP